MNLREAQEKFERLFRQVIRGGTTSRAPNGAPYVAICGGGVKEEGDPFPVKFASEELAAEWWLCAALDFTRTKFHTLFWRQEPVIDFEDADTLPIGRIPYCVVYSRFVTE